MQAIFCPRAKTDARIYSPALLPFTYTNIHWIPSKYTKNPLFVWPCLPFQIDLRFGNRVQGSLSVVVAPVLRFVDVGYNADVRIEQLGEPDKIINGFAPELFGRPLDEGDVLETDTKTKDGITYYEW